MRSSDYWMWGLVAVAVYLIYHQCEVNAAAAMPPPTTPSGSGGGSGTMSGLNGIATTGWPPPYLLR